MAKWAELTSKKAPDDGVLTVPYVVGRYFAEVVPTKASGSQKSDNQEKAWVLKFFGSPTAPLDDVEPQHIREFMRWRAAEARAAAVAKQQARKTAHQPGKSPPHSVRCAPTARRRWCRTCGTGPGRKASPSCRTRAQV